MSGYFDYQQEDRAIRQQMEDEKLEEGVCFECWYNNEETVELAVGYETVSGHPNDPNANGYECLYCPKCGKTYDRWYVGC